MNHIVRCVITLIAAGGVATTSLAAQRNDLDQLRGWLHAIASDAQQGRALGSAEHRRVLRTLTDAASGLGLREVTGAPMPLVELSVGSSMALGLENRPQLAGVDIIPLYPEQWGYPAVRERAFQSTKVVRLGRVGPATREWTAQSGRVVLVEPPIRANGTVDYNVFNYLDDLAGVRSAAAIGIIALDLVPASWMQRQTAPRFALVGPPRLEGWPPIFMITAQNAAVAVPGMEATTRLKFDIAERRVTPPLRNVYFELVGSDPSLRREYVVLSAPSDYRGVRAAGYDGDSIYNGADDGGSGAVALLGVAAQLVRSGVRPKRSILFVWHSGTEHDFLGSEWFVRQPPVPLDRIKAVFNVERLARGGDTLYAVGARVAPSTLRSMLDTYTASTGIPLDWSWDVAGAPLQWSERADHRHYAAAKIPAVTINSGLHDDWRTVHDSVERIDVARFASRLDWLVGAILSVSDAR